MLRFLTFDSCFCKFTVYPFISALLSYPLCRDSHCLQQVCNLPSNKKKCWKTKTDRQRANITADVLPPTQALCTHAKITYSLSEVATEPV